MAISLVFLLKDERNQEHPPKNSLHPRDDFVTGGVRRLVEVDDTGADIGLDITLQRLTSGRDGSVMGRPDKD